MGHTALGQATAVLQSLKHPSPPQAGETRVVDHDGIISVIYPFELEMISLSFCCFDNNHCTALDISSINIYTASQLLG